MTEKWVGKPKGPHPPPSPEREGALKERELDH